MLSFVLTSVFACFALTVNVPKYDPATNDYNPLEGWIQRQRLKMRKNSGLSSEQKQRLLDLGLTPSAKTDKAIDDDDDSKASEQGNVDKADTKSAAASAATSQRMKQWEIKFEQLKEFQEKNGHCKTLGRPKQGRWCVLKDSYISP